MPIKRPSPFSSAPSSNASSIRTADRDRTQKVRDGDKTIHILTNLTQRDASTIRVAEIYRKRWRIEGLFQELTQALRCEIDTLAYPRAAVFAFCLAVKAYNAVSLVRAVLRSKLGEEQVEELKRKLPEFQTTIHDEIARLSIVNLK